MPNKTLNARLLWMQFEDVLAPRLGLNVWDRAVYSYLLRHSLVIGKLRLHFSIISIAAKLSLSKGPVRLAVRRLDELGALRLLERSKTGHLVEMRLPEQIRTLRPGKNAASRDADESPAAALEAMDLMKTWTLRKTIHDRERGACFYCLRRLPPTSSASTTSFRARASDAIPTATWFPAAWNATRARATVRPGIFSALFTARGA